MRTHKGSWSRVQDQKAFAANYDSIFRKKEPEAKPFSPFDIPPEPACPNHESLEDVLTDPESGFSKS